MDASKEAPNSWLYVRGRTNSVLLVEPKGENITSITYVVEKNPAGWAFISSAISNFVAGQYDVLVLSDLKRVLEQKSNDEEEGLTVEQIARRRFENKLKQEAKAKEAKSIVDDPSGVSKEDVRATVAVLEAKLASLRAMEKNEKMDLSELRHRVEADLKKARTALSHTK